MEIELLALEVEQVHVDDRQAGLAAGLRRDPPDQVAGQHADGLATTGQARDLHVSRVM